MAAHHHELDHATMTCRRCGRFPLEFNEPCERPKPTLVELPKRDPTPTKEHALEAVESLRKKVESGEVVAFIAVGIFDDDTIEGFCGSSKPVTRLRLHGAVAALEWDILSGKF